MDFMRTDIPIPEGIIALLIGRRLLSSVTDDKGRRAMGRAGLEAVIGLDQEWNGTGSVRHCSYLDGASRINVPAAEGWRDWAHRVYIDASGVSCSWCPAGADLSAVIAKALTDPDAPRHILARQREHLRRTLTAKGRGRIHDR